MANENFILFLREDRKARGISFWFFLKKKRKEKERESFMPSNEGMFEKRTAKEQKFFVCSFQQSIISVLFLPLIILHLMILLNDDFSFTN